MIATASHRPAPAARYRVMETGDVNLIFSSWLRSYGKALKLLGAEKASFLKQHHEVVGNLLERGKVLVAVDPQAPSEVWAWLCFEVTPSNCLVHYAYTKQLYRRFGLARRLVEMALSIAGKPMAHSHETDAGLRLAGPHRSAFLPETAK